VLVVDSSDRPQGWLDVPGRHGSGEITPELLNLGGTLAEAGAPLRATLDAALSSPSGRGVIVDDGGRLLGTVTIGDVVARIEALGRSGAAAGSAGS
jgi:osmoprotectant transport system ATP-binding protein